MQSPLQHTWLSKLLDEIALPGLPQFSRATIAGISVAIIGNILISLALNCQKLAHRRLEREHELRNTPSNGSHVDRRRNGVKRNLRDNVLHPTAEEEDGELTPTGLPLRQVLHSSETDEPSIVAPTETQPLLPRTQSDSSPGENSSVLKRVFPWVNHRRSAGPPRSFVPVDIVVIEPSGATRRQASPVKGNQEDDNRSESDYLKSKLWWFGFALMNVGEMGNFISYAFAPASVVAPLGTFALIANCFFAPVMLKERFRKRDVFGILVAVVGAVTVVLSANSSDTRLNPDSLLRAISQKVFIVFSILYVVAALVLSSLSEGSVGQRHVFVDVGLCAIFGGFTVLSTKALSTLLTMEWFEIFTEWITYPVIAVLLGTGIGQIRYLNRALMRFDSKIVVPTQFVMFNLSAIVGSAILYGDFRRATFHQIVTFLYGCAATFAGVFIIAWASGGSESHGTEGEGMSTREDEDLEAAISSRSDAPIPRDVRMGSLSRRDRPTLVIPEAIAEGSPATPILRNRQSLVNLIGLSPAQRVLLVHSPRDEFARTLSHSSDRDDAHDFRRRRAISWIGEGSPAWRGNGRIRSNNASRDTSLNRSSQLASRSPPGNGFTQTPL
ncbi:magnesium transporter NIPA-domain-containing protein [Cytidiella melzeri]|nr:magnesium transporter NIPA-domain-containing protein [Cytidiella melzeri]